MPTSHSLLDTVKNGNAGTDLRLDAIRAISRDVFKSVFNDGTIPEYTKEVLDVFRSIATSQETKAMVRSYAMEFGFVAAIDSITAAYKAIETPVEAKNSTYIGYGLSDRFQGSVADLKQTIKDVIGNPDNILRDLLDIAEDPTDSDIRQKAITKISTMNTLFSRVGEYSVPEDVKTRLADLRRDPDEGVAKYAIQFGLK